MIKTTILAAAAVTLLAMPAMANDNTHATATHTAAAVKADPFATADTDKNGALSKDEFTAAKWPVGTTFEKIDANADNSISAEEWKAHHDAAKPVHHKK